MLSRTGYIIDENKDVNKAMDQKALKDWANETD